MQKPIQNKFIVSEQTKDTVSFILGALLLIYFIQLLGLTQILSLIFITFFAYLKIVYRKPKVKNFRIIHLVFLFVLMLAIIRGMIEQGFSVYAMPIAIIAMLETILFRDLELAFASVVTLSLVTGIIAGNHLALTIFLLVGGTTASCLVLNVRRRADIIRAGFFVGVIQVLSLFFIHNFQIYMSTGSKYLIAFLNGIFSSIFVIGTLSIFEYLFRTITNITLLELSDFNHPLLKKMTLEAAGTYHHSLIVGNLSEAACESIGANALLARIGAYYHDIGKIEKGEYFSENQKLSASKHDKLAASVSKSVIMNHVKEGIELAKKYKLNQKIIDFISQHHGTSLVYYFYRRALEELEQDKEIQEEGFRYPGPKPHTRETAIVLLADSVEAACRSLIDPTPSKIEELVRKIINNKFIDGQLDECDLTLKDLERIANIFSHILASIYHARIQYPEQDAQDTDKKPAKQNSHIFNPPKTPHQQDNEPSQAK